MMAQKAPQATSEGNDRNRQASDDACPRRARWLALGRGAPARQRRSSVLDHGANALAGVKQLESFIDALKRQLVRDEGID